MLCAGIMEIILLSLTTFVPKQVNVLSCLSPVQRFVTPSTASPRLLCSWDSPGKNTGVGCHALVHGSSWPRDQTQVSCIAGGFFTHWTTWEPRWIISVPFSRSVVSNSLLPHGLQHAGLPCPSPTPRAYSNSYPSSQWCCPTISSSVVPFSSWFQSFPVSGSFPVSQFFTSSGQSNGASASASALPMNIQDWFPLGWTGWISLQSTGLSRVFSSTTVQKHQFFGAQLSL